MKSHIKFTLVILLALFALPALALDCDNHHIIVNADTLTFLDEPIEPYDACWELRVVGTINGRNVNCGFYSELCGPYGCFGRTSDEIWGDGWIEFAAWKVYGWFESEKGVIETREWLWFDLGSGMEAGVVRIIGGSGDFEGASGFLSYSAGYPNREKFHYKARSALSNDVS